MRKISTRKYEEQIQNILKNKGFNEAQISHLIRGYAKYESEHEFERTENFSSVLDMLSDGVKPSSQDMRDKLLALIEYAKERNLTMPQTVALHIYTESQFNVLQLKRKNSTGDELIKFAEERLFEDIKSYKKADLKENEIEAVRKIINIIKRELKKNTFTSFECLDKMNLGDYYHCFSFFAYTCSEIVKAYKIIPLMDSVLKNQLPTNTILYRGISKEYLQRYFDTKDFSTLVGKTLVDEGYSSTSLLFNSCYGYYSNTHVTLKLYTPKGTEGLDVTNFSNFDTENEILLNSNEVYIMDYKEYSPGCIMLTGLVLSKNIECYKDIGKGPEKSNNNDEENE